ncbi:MAG: hypothetical protein A2445_04845 [Candidatus Jacksonbacteria bacterium RIFOXYC2_FULL_44_29]|nr:MAG: hypothetical protein UW45_C0002G0017 [Parcubacteria group bacterium GW2011_GWC2_44_22]OGY75188.1 MAG: hypothetical protein A2240_01130 [Candidatus Jacksonbacteria bacterium RIFOXYA2_FULL_43_12]OGY75650.1 MAG: hypothetical protein A2295_04725 [Candidatus Jacksonbacteria bacterium RIFOXYB2_FULL_44_15]OGY77794.1 MAG: hypothetical protein A2445_04845 [Candidatus Jacksonbacteria bacterium RIFOXYC2_FULL_44_29]OGY79524.1 MAG: hypothetical protein A2550_02135 [Candidatus Jacksonbacteria bacteri
MISQEYQKKATKQDYSKKTEIDGVKIIDLPYFIDDGGGFCELARLVSPAGIKDYFPEFETKQVNWSYLEPGVIKAGHLHESQEDIWFVPPTDRLIVGLLDVREKSKTLGNKMRLVLGACKARLLYVPRGVVHGCANPYNRPMTVIYLVNQYWDGSDELRIPDQEFGEGFWEIQKG